MGSSYDVVYGLAEAGLLLRGRGLARGGVELLVELPLLVGDLGRHRYGHPDHQVASGRGVRAGQTLPGDPQHGSDLGSGGDLQQHLVTVQGGDLLLPTDHEFRIGGGDSGPQVVAVAVEGLVGTDVDHDEQVSRGTSVHTVVALSGDPHPHAVLHSRRHVDVDLGLLGGPSASTAVGTLLGS